LNSIFDNVVHFAISEILRCTRAQIRNPGVHPQADLRISTSIDSVTTRAAGQELFSPLLQGVRGQFEWIPGNAVAPGNGQVSRRSGHYRLECRRPGGSAEASPNQQAKTNGRNYRGSQKRQKNYSPFFHECSTLPEPCCAKS
jgi:hypothetical protein